MGAIGTASWLVRTAPSSADTSVTPTATAPAESPTTTTVLAGNKALQARSAPRRAQPMKGPWDAVEASARAKFGDDFAGIAMIDGTVTVLVKARRGLPATFEANPVTQVKHSLKELQAAQDKISLASPELEERGVLLAEVGVDVSRNVVSVTLVSGPDELAGKRMIVEAVVGTLPARYQAGSVVQIITSEKSQKGFIEENGQR